MSRALAPDRQHVGIDVERGRLRAGAAGLHDAHGDIAGAAGDVEQMEGAIALRRVDGGDQNVLPGAMQPARHQVVHQVVAARDLVEYVVDQPLLVGEGHLAEAEMGVLTGRAIGLLAVRHEIFLFAEHHSAAGRQALSHRSASRS